MSLPPLDDGGAGDDEPTRGGPPHPMDRIWRHPSELPSLADPPAGSRRATPVRLRSFLVPIGAGAIGALLTVGVLAAAGAFDQRTVSGGDNRPSTAGHSTDAIASVAKRIAPAIVAVRVVGKSGSRSGSGVCIRHGGQVLTSARLVAGARRIQLVLSDGTVRTARVIGTDPASDLALLTTDGNLEAADLAAPRSLQVGQPVYAVGADSSGTPWVSEGIVSSLDTRVAGQGTTMTGLIESNALTDSSVAGGALLDAAGGVTGIVISPVNGHPTIVAVPILLAGRVADDLRAGGHVDHGWLGLAGRVTKHGQLVVTAIATGGPSAVAGVRVGDVVVNADSQPIATMDDLMAAARGHWPGERIQLEVTRDNTDINLSVRLASMPSSSTSSSTAPPTSTTSTPFRTATAAS
jgi:S1-C subfamily serine protease